MATANLNKCLEEILRHEGGYADHPNDPGGATNMGITHKTLARWRRISPWWQLPKSEIKALNQREVTAIYKARYWDRVAGNALPGGLDLTLFDFAVNSGPVRAIKALQRELKVRADGAIGPITRSALKAHIARTGISALIRALCARRLSFLMRLAIFATFGRGWVRRVDAIRRAALELAGTDTNEKLNQRRLNMDVLSGYKTYIIGALMLLAGIAQGLGLDVPGFDGQTTGQLIMEGFAIIFLRKGLKSEIGNA